MNLQQTLLTKFRENNKPLATNNESPSNPVNNNPQRQQYKQSILQGVSQGGRQ